MNHGGSATRHQGQRSSEIEISGTALIVVDAQQGFADSVWGRRDNPGQSGHDFIPGVEGPHELLVTKSVNSAFYGSPNLDVWLRSAGSRQVVICGITANHCCETTARMAGNLGHDVTFVLDATHPFDRVGPDGVVVTAEDLARATAASLHGESAAARSTDDVVASIRSGPAAS